MMMMMKLLFNNKTQDAEVQDRDQDFENNVSRRLRPALKSRQLQALSQDSILPHIVLRWFHDVVVLHRKTDSVQASPLDIVKPPPRKTALFTHPFYVPYSDERVFAQRKLRVSLLDHIVQARGIQRQCTCAVVAVKH